MDQIVMEQDHFRTLEDAVAFFSNTKTRSNGEHSMRTRKNTISLLEDFLKGEDFRIRCFQLKFVAFGRGKLNPIQAQEFLRELNVLYREYLVKSGSLGPLRGPDVGDVGVIDDDIIAMRVDEPKVVYGGDV